MSQNSSNIRFKAKLLRPAEAAKGSSWTFLVLPKNASTKLPSRGMTAVQGNINGHPFRATLEPDGQKSHWLKVTKARALWSEITPIARRDWIHWITSAKRAETRARRVDSACDRLASGKRRVCRFDRSGFYSKSFAAKAADPA